MKKFWLVIGLLAVSGCAAPVDSEDVGEQAEPLDSSSGHGAPEDAKLGLHWAKGAQPAGGNASASPLLLSHGGNIMQSMSVEPIFWGRSWTSGNDKVTGLATFYTGLGGTNYALTNGEYYGPVGTTVGSPAISVNAAHIDNSAALGHAPRVSDIQTVVCRNIKSPVANGYYPVYVDQPRGHAGYCAWHSYGNCGTTPVQFAFFFKLDGDAGCDPQDTSGQHSQGLAALANVSGHELSETLTDPRNGGWYDASGNENADKCAWTFGSKLLSFGNGSQWKVQGNWSNNAYTQNTGYQSGSSAVVGCIDGTN
jgi:hypothetical protein